LTFVRARIHCKRDAGRLAGYQVNGGKVKVKVKFSLERAMKAQRGVDV
jgi:hypothetical protein